MQMSDDTVRIRGHKEPFGQLEGDLCRRPIDGGGACRGIIETAAVENCSCHIAPPCSACTTPREHCPECGWQAVDDEVPFNGFLVRPAAPVGAWSSFRPRPLDRSKIDWRDKPHTNSSMVKEGCFPQGTPQSEVRALVNGTFGGRFERWDDQRCEFRFVAYTD